MDAVLRDIKAESEQVLRASHALRDDDEAGRKQALQRLLALLRRYVAVKDSAHLDAEYERLQAQVQQLQASIDSWEADAGPQAGGGAARHPAELRLLMERLQAARHEVRTLHRLRG